MPHLSDASGTGFLSLSSSTTVPFATAEHRIHRTCDTAAEINHTVQARVRQKLRTHRTTAEAARTDQPHYYHYYHYYHYSYSSDYHHYHYHYHYYYYHHHYYCYYYYYPNGARSLDGLHCPDGHHRLPSWLAGWHLGRFAHPNA